MALQWPHKLCQLHVYLAMMGRGWQEEPSVPAGVLHAWGPGPGTPGRWRRRAMAGRIFLLYKMEEPRKSLLWVVERSQPNHSCEGTLAVLIAFKNKEKTNQGNTLKMFQCQSNRDGWSGWYSAAVCLRGGSAHGWHRPGQCPLCDEGPRAPLKGFNEDKVRICVRRARAKPRTQ